jgi:UDP-N-acetylmuramate dehydrogenase
MHVQREVDLQPFNTLAVPATAERFCIAMTLAQLQEALATARNEHLELHVLGGGSNVVLRPRLDGLVVQMGIKGRDVLTRTETEVTVRVGAGENWHELVEWCLSQGFYGLENLALIPGTVGAAPVQNIGAYGVEIFRFIERVEGLSLPDGKPAYLNPNDCEFAYRDSVFKHRLRGHFIITTVVFRLPRTFSPEVSYPALREALTGDVTAQAVFDAVCRVRRSKLPDPQVIPNCGSFFKNPIVPWALFESLQQQYPAMPSYPIEQAPVAHPTRKLAAAWLIDQTGWRGRVFERIKVHEHQALVLTNPERVSAEAILAAAEAIRADVEARFGVVLEMEPQIFGNR